MIIYSKSAGNNPAAIGKIETPIKMIIEHESDLIAKRGGVCDWLFNIEKSNHFGETIVTQSEFDIFQAAREGEAAATDCIAETSSKFIEHIQFMKEFIITAEMMEDANYGVAPEAKRRAESFTRAYYKTINKICEAALINASNSSMTYAGANVDLTTADGKPLFSNSHSYGTEGQTQSNFYYGNMYAGGGTYDPSSFGDILSILCHLFREMKDENGDPLGYTADTLIIPSNRFLLEATVKKLCGTIDSIGSQNNEINIHYNNWNVIILPSWQTDDDAVILMSSEANRNLSGNMFFNRVPLTITNWVDHHTGNYIWNGRCRFGVGFGSYKHALMIVNSEEPVQGASDFNLVI